MLNKAQWDRRGVAFVSITALGEHILIRSRATVDNMKRTQLKESISVD